ncbi:MAG: hypothetical protein D3924_20365, partial [Candidatus Electrothrix sp. AR4]|nr:hypothetical protein [Candidatus Electrothrix sp. AR4]
MTENVQVALIVAAALVVIVAIVVFVFRDKFQKGSIKVNQDGIQLDGENQAPAEPPLASVSGNKIKGDGHALSARNGGKI